MVPKQALIVIYWKKVNESINIPIIASGGAGSMAHFTEVFQKANVDAALIKMASLVVRQ